MFMTLVREFYQNISFGEDTVSSSVKGKKIDFDDEIFGQILKLPTEDDLLDSIENRSERMKSVLGVEDYGQFRKIYGRQLNVEMTPHHCLLDYTIQSRRI